MARILIAEHNQTTAEFLAKNLRKQGHNITAVDNCLDTWRQAGNTEYDVMLIDVVMPGIDSFVLAQKALQENPMLQIIFITGFAGVAMDTLATPRYAPAPITTRPFHLSEIGARVRFVLGQGGLPMPRHETHAAAEQNDTVVYADFSARRALRNEASAV